MKSVLIVINNMNIGGIQKSLLELLKALSKREDFSVSLFCCKGKGAFFDKIPETIEILPLNKWAEVAESSVAQAKKLGFRYYLFRIMASLWSKLFSKKIPAKILCKKIKIVGEYDVAISYSQPINEKAFCTLTNEIVLNSCKAKKKITFVHCDFEKYGGNTPVNRALYKNFDAIATVSDSVGEVLSKCIPEAKDKIQTVYNFCDADEIKTLSKEENIKYSKKTLITVARLSEEKGILRCVPIVSRLKEQGIDFAWHIVGGGALAPAIQSAIKEYRLEETIILEGEQINPYKYMKNAHYFFLPSLHEAAPMVFDEAIALNLPILTTKTLSATELVEKRRAGKVCENSENGIYAMLYSALTEEENQFEAVKLDMSINARQFACVCDMEE